MPAYHYSNFLGVYFLSYLDGTLLGLNLGIADLAVVDDDGVAAGATGPRVGLANALGEFGVGVGQEELQQKSAANSRHGGSRGSHLQCRCRGPCWPYPRRS